MPLWNAVVAAVPLDTEFINNPGKSIPAIYESCLMLATYRVKIYTSILRLVTTKILSIRYLKSFRQHRETVENHTKPEAFPMISKHFRIVKVLEQFLIYLEEKLGINKVTFAYIIRNNVKCSNPLSLMVHSKPWSGER